MSNLKINYWNGDFKVSFLQENIFFSHFDAFKCRLCSQTEMLRIDRGNL